MLRSVTELKVSFLVGSQEYGALRRFKQSNKISGALPAVDGQNHGGVLPAGRQRERTRHGDQSNV